MPLSYFLNFFLLIAFTLENACFKNFIIKSPYRGCKLVYQNKRHANAKL